MDNAIHRAMVQIMREASAIAKEKVNRQQNFQYRSIDDIYNMLHPIMARNGVYMRSEVVELQREQRASRDNKVVVATTATINYFFIAEDGSSCSTQVPAESLDYGDKSIPKCLAIGHKYALLQTFLIPTDDLDPDAEVHELMQRNYVQDEPKIISDAQRKRMEARISELQIDREQVKNWIFLHTDQKTTHIRDLSTTLYRELDTKIDAYAQFMHNLNTFNKNANTVLLGINAKWPIKAQHLMDVPTDMLEKVVAHWAKESHDAIPVQNH